MSTTGRGVHINTPLNNVAIAYRPNSMIADQIAPVVNVNKQSDSFYKWEIADAFRIWESKRAPATEANVMERNMSSDTYYAKNYALKDRIPYEDIENADAGMLFTERSSRIMSIKDALMLDMEQRVALKCTSGSNVGSYSATGSAWDDYANSDPILDIETGILNVEDSTGYRPNSILLSRKAWRHLRNNTTLIGRIFGEQSRKVVKPADIADLFELERVLVGGALYNTAARNQTATLSPLWSDDVLIYYAPKTARKDAPSFMYSFRWNKISNMQAYIYQLPKSKAEEIELAYYQDEKITASALGFLITNVESST